MKFKWYSLKLVGVCVIAFIIQIFVPGFTELFVLNNLAWKEVWRFVTPIFLHGDLGHLLYNMLALGLFGSFLEKFVGGKKFFLIFFGSGIVANLISINFYDSSLGASGAIYGVIGALMIIRPLMMVWAFGVPMPMILAGTLWALGDLVGLLSPSNVAHMAHLSGLVIGLIFGAFFRGDHQYEKYARRNNIIFHEDSVRSWEDRYMR